MKPVTITILMLLVFIISCREEIISPGTPDSNLITNSSFEENNRPTLRGWEVSGQVGFSTSTPPGGGSHSVRIEASWGPLNYITYTLPAMSGTRIYEFSCWGISTGGNISLSSFRDTIKTIKQVTVSSDNWNHYTLIDTITGSRGDMISVSLFGSFATLLERPSLYDRCTLKVK
jgi:hypothetical protein